MQLVSSVSEAQEHIYTIGCSAYAMAFMKQVSCFTD